MSLLRPLSPELEEAFFAYCARYGRDHDESFIPSPPPPEEKGKYRPGGPCPSYLLLGQPEEPGAPDIQGVLSLIVSPSHAAAGKARVAVLHAQGGSSPEGRARYQALIDQLALFTAHSGLKPYLFLPAGLEIPAALLKGKGFKVERIVHAMRKSGLGSSNAESPGPARVSEGPSGHFPEGFEVKHLAAGDDAALSAFVAVRNRNFREVEGSLDATVEEWRARLVEPGALEGGAMLLLDPGGGPCGCLYAERDEDDGSLYLGTIGVDRDKRRMGLARSLVRHALRFGEDRGFGSASLSVNESNAKALSLYLSEGFRIEKSMACLSPGPEWPPGAEGPAEDRAVEKRG